MATNGRLTIFRLTRPSESLGAGALLRRMQHADRHPKSEPDWAWMKLEGPERAVSELRNPIDEAAMIHLDLNPGPGPAVRIQAIRTFARPQPHHATGRRQLVPPRALCDRPRRGHAESQLPRRCCPVSTDIPARHGHAGHAKERRQCHRHARPCDHESSGLDIVTGRVAYAMSPMPEDRQ